MTRIVFEIIRRHIKSGGRSFGFDLYPLPGGKFDGNNSIGRQFSIGLIGGGNSWHEADKVERKRIWETHKQYTLEFFHFLTNDPVVPKPIRDQYTKLGLCNDEFANYGHFFTGPLHTRVAADERNVRYQPKGYY